MVTFYAKNPKTNNYAVEVVALAKIVTLQWPYEVLTIFIKGVYMVYIILFKVI